jgi:hypothetical protein
VEIRDRNSFDRFIGIFVTVVYVKWHVMSGTCSIQSETSNTYRILAEDCREEISIEK